jgi:hypothetical protein
LGDGPRVTELPDQVATSPASVDVLTRRTNAVGVEPLVRIRFCDKIRALELLGRLRGLFKDRLAVDLSLDLVARLTEGTKRESTRRGEAT